MAASKIRRKQLQRHVQKDSSTLCYFLGVALQVDYPRTVVHSSSVRKHLVADN